MIAIVCGLWAPNKLTKYNSFHYAESDVEKLYRGFKRHLSMPFRFVCWTDRLREYDEPIEQRLLCKEKMIHGEPHYGSLTQCFELNEPSIFCGLDTIIVGNVDHMAAYCIGADKPAAPLDPYLTHTTCNAVVLVPGGHGWMWEEGKYVSNDMDFIRQLYTQKRLALIDDLFPEQVFSYKAHVKKMGLPDDARIVYFHGAEKPHELPHVGWIARHFHDNVKAAA